MTSVLDSGVSLESLEQTILEGALLSTLVQTVLTGIYIIIFIQTITLILAAGRQKAYAAVLTLICAAITANLAIFWKALRGAVRVHNATRMSMAVAFVMESDVATKVVLNFTARSGIVLADVIMVWRCCTLWEKSKILLLGFSLLILGEFVLLLRLTLPNLSATDATVGVPAFYFISSATTILATALITTRIVAAVKQSAQGELGVSSSSRYMIIIAIVVESGVLYAVSMVVVSVLYVIVRGGVSPRAVQLGEGALVWEQALVPITGIATTLIAFRVETGRVKQANTMFLSKPMSTLQFEGMGAQTRYSDDTDMNLITHHSNHVKDIS